jgi:hypothetical protein
MSYSESEPQSSGNYPMMCLLLLIVGVLILLTAYGPMDQLVRWLRGASSSRRGEGLCNDWA